MEFLLTKYLGFSPSWHSLRAISITMLVHNHFLLSQPLLSNLSLLPPPPSLILWFYSQGVNLARWGSEGGRHPSDLKVRGGAICLYAGVQRRAPDLPTGGIALPSRFILDVFFSPQDGNTHPGIIGKYKILISYITNRWKQAQAHIKPPNPHHGHMQWHRSNQVQSVCWILDEADAALQRAPRVKVPDFAWVTLRLIRVPVTASRFGSEHELQRDESSLSALSPSLPPPSGTSGWLFKRPSRRKRNFLLHPL